MTLIVPVEPHVAPPIGDPLTPPVFGPSVNYIRYCQVIVTGAGGALNLSAMRITFSIKQSTLQAPNMGKIRIYNLAKSTQEPLRQKEYTKVVLIAGYQGNFGIIFSGDIMQVNLGRESPVDTYCDIFAADGNKAVSNAVLNKALAAGSTPQDHWNEMLQALQKIDPSITAGYVGPDLSMPKYPRAVSLYGMVRHGLRMLSQSKDAQWSIQDGQLTLVGNKSAIPGTVAVLNSTTGLIGMPTETIGGIMVRALINPQYRPNTLLQIDQASINPADLEQAYSSFPAQQLALSTLGTGDGIYRVLQIIWSGDTRGVPWYADMACVGAITGSAPPALAQQGFA